MLDQNCAKLRSALVYLVVLQGGGAGPPPCKPARSAPRCICSSKHKESVLLGRKVKHFVNDLEVKLNY